MNTWKFRDYLLYSILLIANFLSSPQNILYILVINLFLFYLHFKTDLKKILIINFVTLIVCIYGITLGGMLTPKIFQVDFSSQVVQTLYSKSSSLGDGLKIIPGIPFYYGSMSSGWNFGNIDLLKAAQNILSEPDLKLANLIWTIESIFFNSVRVLSIPIIGIIFLIFHLKLNKVKFSFKDNEYFKFCFITFLFFTIGFIINFFISFNGYKWEFSRFLIPGYFLSYIAFCLFLEYLFIEKKISFLIFIFIFILVIFGPFLDFLLTIINNFYNMINNLDFLNKFFGVGPLFNKDYCFIK